jgi:hypothetical protein
MAQNRLGGPGIGLPYPQALYPVQLVGAAPQPATNVITLGYGEAFPVPPGEWMIAGAPMQWLDPVSGQWLFAGATAYSAGSTAVSEGYVHSDGQNLRVVNPQGIATGATVTAAGSGYVQATTTVTSSNSSTWTAVVGGAISLTLGTGGSGYTIPPVVLISAPPSPGLQATAVATVSGGIVTGFTIVNAGAGYTTAPTVLIVANPYDPNYGSIVNATATASLTGSGTVTAVLCTNYGAPGASAPTLTINGVGSSATAATTAFYTAESTNLTVYLQPL